MTTPPSSPPLFKPTSDANDSRMSLKQQQSIGVMSPPLSPFRSLSQTTQHRASQETSPTSPPPFSLQSETHGHTILYSGDMILCTPQSRFSRQKRCYCILTPTSLVRFKSLDKAKKAYPGLTAGGGSNGRYSNSDTPHHHHQDQKVMTSLEHVFAVYKIQLSSFQQAIRINFVDPVDLSRPPGSVTLVPVNSGTDMSSSSLISIWVHAIRTALEPYLPGLITINSAEQFAAVERTKKQNDQVDPTQPSVVHKVILKTTKINPKPVSSSSSTSSLASNSNSTTVSVATTSTVPAEQKDVYIPVIFLLGQNSLYILPSKSDHDDYRRYVTRDRYGLMAISGIVIHDSDDTITIDLCTLQGPSHRLKLVSSVGRLLVCALQKAVQRLVPHFPSAPYTLVCPSLVPQQRVDTGQITTAPVTHWRHYLSQPWKQQKISPQSIQNHSSNDSSSGSLYNRITTQFGAVLMAYCAALNLDKRRFGYAITKSQQRSRMYSISILPSNEINGNFASYSKYELLALFRTLRHMDVFDSVSFNDIRLAPLAKWLITKGDSWTQKDLNSMCFPTMLANEVFLLLTHNNRIRLLDLRASYFTSNTPPPPLQLGSNEIAASLSRFPTTMSLVRTPTMNDGSDGLPTPQLQGLQQLPSATTASCQQCTIQAILLAVQTNKELSLSTLLIDNHACHGQDIELFSQLILSSSSSSTSPPPSPSVEISIPQTLILAGLRHLSLRRCQLSTANLEDLMLSMADGPLQDCIERLDLQENQGLISTTVFMQVWKKCKRLSHLGVSCHFKPGDKLDLLPKVMNELDLSGSPLGDNDDDPLSELCAWLTHHATTLRPSTKTQFDLSLVLARCGLHGQHVHRLVHAVSVPHHRRLHFTLKLGENPLIKQVVYQPWLWSSLAKHGPTSLSLEKLVWESATLRELFESLIQNNMVERLDLSGATVNHGHAASSSTSFESLEENVTVARRGSTLTTSSSESHRLARHTSNASPSTFDPSTVQAMAVLLEKMTHLAWFCMDAEQQDDIYAPNTTAAAHSSNNKVAPRPPAPRGKRMTHAGNLLSSTFRRLALTTSFSPTLTHLSIKHHGLGDTTIRALCQWCKRCPSLQSLNVDGNLLTIAGFRSLLDLVQTNSHIHDLPRPELDFRRELHRLESQAWQLQESEGELQYLVIHMVGVDGRRARALIEDQAAAREAIMVDRSQLPIVADQLDQQVLANATLYQSKSKHVAATAVQPYWPTDASSTYSVASTVSRPPRRRSSSIQSFYLDRPISDPLPPPTGPLPAIPSFPPL